ncbi:amino acid adenylation domain-containing protein [Flavobacterium sp.]|uniref:non-ribosomal peptide synthetase n=1 Tax=Flavobacterium sp. TaxID=239 RepID=UPI003D0FCBF7
MKKTQIFTSTVLTLFNQIFLKNPLKTALVFNDESINYDQLNARSNQLAHYLRTKGDFLNVPICFSLEQSIDKVIVMMAIWKAAGAYVSLDPLYPQLRLEHILNDTNSPILITSQVLSEKFNFFNKEVIVIDNPQEAAFITNCSEQSLAENGISEGLAYLAYTSGSTGLPKAVMAEHKGLLNFIKYFGEFLNGSPDDVALNISSSNFDGIVLDLWVPLSLGMTVCLYPDNRILGDALLDYIRKNEVTVLPYLPVSILATLPTDQHIGRLRKIFTGGEAPAEHVIQPWRKLVTLINIYGPTETTVVVCGFEFSDNHPLTTIGKPLPNVEFYALDDQLKPVPNGEIGQLHIGGVQVSRGYFNQPELTAEKFVYYTNPLGKKKRVYKTGDLVRILADGNTEFIGRADQQFKIRGFRIELSEIENTIRKSGLVENSCVIVKGDSPDNKHMVCYYKKNSQRDTFPEHIRSYLYEHLPNYMIPSRFLQVENFPLTSNGKIDRKALGNYDSNQEEERQFVDHPSTELQKKLAESWKSILRIKTIGINDNFFHFGGNSILAYKLVSSIRQKFQFTLQITDLFLYPTVSELENYIIDKQPELHTEELIISAPDKPVKLSAQQQSLWFLDKLHGSLPYHIGALYPVEKGISIAILEKAFRILMHKHSILRTLIHEEDHTAYQTVISENNWTLQQLYDPNSLQELINIPFDLEKDYILRAYLVYESNEITSLFIIIHHIAADGWSMSLLTKELNDIYIQIQNKKELIISHYPIQYRDYSNWQLSYLNSEKCKSGIAFWKNYLEDIPVLQLAYDYSKQHFHNNTGQQYRFKIEPELASVLRKFSAEQHVTLYMTLLSAFGLLMQHYSGQHDICIGSPAANRIPSTVDETIGYFVNMLPVRIQIKENPIYEDYLAEIKKMLLTVFQHQEIPLETIINNVIKDRFTGHNPLFQTVFVLQDTAEQNAVHTPVNGHNPNWIFNEKSKFDLQLEVTPINNELEVVIEYSNSIFKDETIIQMAKDFQVILESIVREPEKRIGDFEILLETQDKDEAQNLSETQENTFEETLVGMFENQVKHNPDKTALTFNGDTISYLELHLQSSKIADQLLAMGVKNNEFVACYLEQSIERIIALLGIIKAGAAYIPLDTSYPIERIAILLRDTDPALLITSKKNSDIDEKVHVCVLDIEHMLSYQPNIESRKSSYTDTHSPNDLIYVIHTSGTTGVPKGVMIEHKAISNFIIEYGKILEISNDDRTLQFSPYNFDGSIMDIWIPLAKGASIYLYPNNKLLGDSLSDFITQHHLTVVPYISPSVLSTISLSIQLPHLRVIGTGGETCPVAISKHWMHQLKLVNGYGPTETTVAVNHHVYDDKHPANTLGTAINNMRLYVLDNYLRRVPVGVIGELYISGIQLSRGYLNQPELTAERFITNPFIKNKEDKLYNRMYKTGDQVRILSSGLIEYVGRIDHQVKIRGYRIEVTEIETALQQVKGIKNVTVQVHTSSENMLSLRAFITGGITVSTIKTELSKKLPSYMIPNQIIPIDKIPVTANGKLDMAALSLLAEQNFDEQEEDTPLNACEETLKVIWSEVLQRKINSLQDDFFQLGGHSLLLTKLYNKISHHYPGRISLSELYINNTIRKLALLIEERENIDQIDHYSFGTDPLSQEIKRDIHVTPSEFQVDLEHKGDFENPKFTLLTGATGLVGVNMLSDLVQTTTAVIYLLIRADNEKHAEERLLKTIREQLLPENTYNKERVKLLTGDLSKPLFGLSPAVYEGLTQIIDVVYHAGSAVNFIQPYSYMKAANVEALKIMIKFATTIKLKQICLLSTVGVYSWEHHFTKPDLIMESDSIEPAFKYLSRDMGYIQSKWVMEQIAMQAIQQGVPIIIFRLGYVFCHSQTGATAKYQWWSLLIKACIKLKQYPILIDQKEELVSVDFISKSIAYISKNPKAIGEIFHLSPAPKDNMTVMEFFETLQKEFNLELKPLPYQEWMKLWENDEKSPLYPLLSLFKFKVYDNKSIIEIHQNTPDFDITNTMKFLEGSDIDSTIVNRNMLETYCSYLGIQI